MKYRWLVLVAALAAVVALASVSMAGQAPGAAATVGSTPSAAPRTAWGDPDLQGIWRGLEVVPFQRPLALGDREFFTDAEVAAKVKALEEDAARRGAGKATNIGFRQQANYNSIFRYFPDPILVSGRTSAIIDPPNGRLPPWTLEQVKRWEEREAATAGHGETDTPQDMNLRGRCIPVEEAAEVGNWGMGPLKNAGAVRNAEQVLIEGGMGGEGGGRAVETMQIIQSSNYIAFDIEKDGPVAVASRIIPLDRRPPLGAKFRQWMGDARGHWEGNTLVVEITNLKHEYPVIPNYGASLYPGSGETLRITQRFTRLDKDHMEYRYTIDAPAIYTRPYTVLHNLMRDDDFKFTGIVCQENTRDLADSFANARADEALSSAYGEQSVLARQPRFEELKQEAIEEAKRQSAGNKSR